MNTSIKNWYKKQYPNDNEYVHINSDITFQYAYDNLINFYKYIGYIDTIVRERIFAQLSIIKKVPYDTIYKKWLDIN